eukprot:6197527-Pleurochrysis_carterae.AAC.3
MPLPRHYCTLTHAACAVHTLSFGTHISSSSQYRLSSSIVDHSHTPRCSPFKANAHTASTSMDVLTEQSLHSTYIVIGGIICTAIANRVHRQFLSDSD